MALLSPTPIDFGAEAGGGKRERVACDEPGLFRLAEAVNRGCDSGEISILAEPDVVFDETLGGLAGVCLDGTCLALTAWRVDEAGNVTPPETDAAPCAWVFQGRIRPLLMHMLRRHGQAGCGEAMLAEAEYRALNPCYDLRAYRAASARAEPASPLSRIARRDPPGTLAALRGPRAERGVIAFSLFGRHPRYLRGAIENALLARHVYPDWTCRFYIDDTVPAAAVEQIEALGGEIERMPPSQGLDGMFWRFRVAGERGYDRWMIRDCDSRLGYRERRAVDEWVASGLPFHIIRDHPWHRKPIMGCAFGGTKGALSDIHKLIAGWQHTGQYGDDEQWLAQVIYPRVRKRALIHDLCARDGAAGQTQPLPTPLENFRFVGERFSERSRCNLRDRAALVEARAARPGSASIPGRARGTASREGEAPAEPKLAQSSRLGTSLAPPGS